MCVEGDYTNLIAVLQVKVAGFGVEAEVNTLPVVTDDVFSPGVLVVAPGNQLMHSAAGGRRKGHQGMCITRTSEGLGHTDRHTCQC